MEITMDDLILSEKQKLLKRQDIIAGEVGGDKILFTAFLQALARLSRFTYTSNNILLMFGRIPTVSYPGGFGMWDSYKRLIQKGSQSIRILAPVRGKKQESAPEGGAGEKQVESGPVNFKVTGIWDVSQTVGPEYSFEPVRMEDGSPELQKAVRELIRITPRSDAADALPNKEAFSALIHTFSQNTLPKREFEDPVSDTMEAEGVAYTMHYYYGLPLDRFGFSGFDEWSAQGVKSFLFSVQEAAKYAITNIDRVIGAVYKEPENGTKQERAPRRQQVR